MKLSVEDVRHVARLARLELSESDEQRLVHELSAILGAVELLSSVDTAGIEPTAYVFPMAGHLRTDAVTGHLSVERVLQNAPQTVATSFAIPRVIE